MEIKITESHGGKTVKDWLFENGFSNNQIKRLKSLDDGIVLNGKRVTVRQVLSEGDILSLRISDDRNNPALVPTEMPISVLYEDDNMIALDKPGNIPTHPSKGHFFDTLANGLAFMFAERREPFVFRAVNRLDRGTSGVVLVAKNSKTAAELSERMRCGEIHKTYYAIVNGLPNPSSGIIDKPICRVADSIITRKICDLDSPGAKRAVTGYQVEFSGKDWSLVKLEPITGRTHQLRVHLASIGCPIAGDELYGTAEAAPTPIDHAFVRPALHCRELCVSLPGRDITISAPMPTDFFSVENFYLRH